MRVVRTNFLALSLAVGLGLWGCTTLPPLSERAAPSRVGTATLVLQPRLTSDRTSQAVVAKRTAASIARLDVVPYVETGTNVYQPLSSTTGQPTTDSDSSLLKASQTAPDLALARPVRLTGLAPNKKYRVFARAYDAQGALLSSDASSYVEVTVGNDDAPSAPASLPLRLADVPFAARADVGLSNGSRPYYDHVVTTLAVVSGGTETPVAGTTQSINKTQVPMTVRLDGLQSQTTYRLNVSLRDGSNAQVATASADIAVTDDDSPATQAIALNVSAAVTSSFVGAYPTKASGLQDGTGTDARLNLPYGAAFDAAGNMYVVEYSNNTLRKVTPQGVVTTFAGAYPTPTSGYVDATGTAARFSGPSGVVIDAAGSLYVADQNNNAIRKVTLAGVVTTFAGGTYGNTDGTGTAAKFNAMRGIAIDSLGNLYVSDSGNNSIRKVTPAGVVTTLAGGTSGFLDGTGSNAKFNNPTGIAVDSLGNVYVSDFGNNAIRKVTPQGVVTTFAGAYPTATQGLLDDTGTAARLRQPWGIATDAADNLFVADRGNNAIRKITPAGVVTTFAGAYPSATPGYTEGTGTAARFNSPGGVAFDAAGNFYVLDTFNHAIRKVQ